MRLRSRILRLYKIQIGLHCGVGRVKPKRLSPLFLGKAVESPRIVGDPQVQSRWNEFRVQLLGAIKFLDSLVMQTFVS